MTDVVAAEQLPSRQRLTFAQLHAHLRLGKQHAIGVVLDGAVIGLPRVAVIAIAVFQNQIATAIGLDFLPSALGNQHRQPAFLSGLTRNIGFGDEHPAELAAISRQFAGVGYP